MIFCSISQYVAVESSKDFKCKASVQLTGFSTDHSDLGSGYESSVVKILSETKCLYAV